MRPLIFMLPLFLQSVISRAAYTVEGVESRIVSYRKTLQHDRSAILSSCQLACGFLSTVLPQQLSIPNSTIYEFEESRYWSQQQELTRPACRLSPTSAKEVSLAVLTSRATGCKFTVKSGGHAAFEGASNIADGITIDLIHLNQITVSADQTEVSIGAGNIWYDVYQHLLPYNLTVIGGRVSAIGMGLILGGGISFVSVQHGLACDNVNTFEVVLADGSIKEVTYSSPYSDLFWALRGGGNNFGIVTRFDVKAYPQGNFFAGSIFFPYTPETVAALNSAFYYVGVNTPQDPFAQVILAYNYVQAVDLFIVATELQYAKPVPYPEILRNFTSAPGGFNSTMGFYDIPTMTVQLNNSNPGGFRQSYWTLTVGNDAALMADILRIWEEEIQNIKDAKGLQSSCVFQPFTSEMLRYTSRDGGNPLGLDGACCLNLIDLAVAWTDAHDDDRVLAAAQKTIDRSATAARDRGLYHPFLYQNYASFRQDVFASYGEDNVRRLRAISEKYDPQQVFRILQPGYHKLPADLR